MSFPTAGKDFDRVRAKIGRMIRIIAIVDDCD